MTQQGINEVAADSAEIDGETLSTLHRMAHQVDEIHKMFTSMRPLLEAYQRGGMLGARTAAKRMGKT